MIKIINFIKNNTLVFLSVLGISITLLSFGVPTKQSPTPTNLQHNNESPFENTIFVPGIIEASSQNISVGTAQGGIISAIFVKPGDKVE